MFKPYDKIVRDKIPRLIESQGRKLNIVLFLMKKHMDI